MRDLPTAVYLSLSRTRATLRGHHEALADATAGELRSHAAALFAHIGELWAAIDAMRAPAAGPEGDGPWADAAAEVEDRREAFAAAHREGMAALSRRDYAAFGEALSREQVLLDEHLRAYASLGRRGVPW